MLRNTPPILAPRTLLSDNYVDTIKEITNVNKATPVAGNVSTLKEKFEKLAAATTAEKNEEKPSKVAILKNKFEKLANLTIDSSSSFYRPAQMQTEKNEKRGNLSNLINRNTQR